MSTGIWLAVWAIYKSGKYRTPGRVHRFGVGKRGNGAISVETTDFQAVPLIFLPKIAVFLGQNFLFLAESRRFLAKIVRFLPRNAAFLAKKRPVLASTASILAKIEWLLPRNRAFLARK